MNKTNGWYLYIGKTVRVAGKMLNRRAMGKAALCEIQDRRGNIQVYIRQDDIGEKAYDDFKNYDIGETVGAIGTMIKMKNGEIGIKATYVDMVKICEVTNMFTSLLVW